MLTLASTMKTSTGRSMLASTHVCRRIHQRMYSSPGLPRMPSGRTMPMRPPGLSHSTQRSMNNTSGATLPCRRPVFRKPPSSVRSQMCARSKLRRMFGSVMGISEPKGGFVITTSIVPSFATFSASARPGRWPGRELERVDVEEIGLCVARHDGVHLCRADQERVEVGAEQVLLHVLGKPLLHREKLLRVLGAGLDAFSRPGTVGQMRERRGEEAARAARRVEHALVGLRVEHRNDELDGAARREVLSAIATQVGADDLLVGGALRVDVGAPEVVLRQLRRP
jgi:hypothetical protein